VPVRFRPRVQKDNQKWLSFFLPLFFPQNYRVSVYKILFRQLAECRFDSGFEHNEATQDASLFLLRFHGTTSPPYRYHFKMVLSAGLS